MRPTCLGHVVLVDELLDRQLITSTVLYAGSEAARGIPKMGVEKPDMQSLVRRRIRLRIADGSKFPEKTPTLWTSTPTIKLDGCPCGWAQWPALHPHMFVS